MHRMLCGSALWLTSPTVTFLQSIIYVKYYMMCFITSTKPQQRLFMVKNSLMEIKEFSKIRTREMAYLGDQMVNIFYGGVKIQEEILKLEEEKDEAAS